MDRQYPLYKPASSSLQRMTSDEMVQAFAPTVITRSGSDADSVSTSPIVAQRLEPEVMPVFVREFPFYDLIEKVPANGLAHTFLQYTQSTQTTDPNTIAESGTVNDDANSYSRKTTNIALFALRRGVSLKAKFAGVQAGGPSQDLMAREVQGGLVTIARDAQMEALRYQESDSSSTTATAVNGKYDANGFNGLRYVLQNQAPPENTVAVDVSSPGWTDQRVLNGIRQAVQVVVDKGGRPDLVVCSAQASNFLFQDQQELVRYMSDRLEITPGRSVRVVSTDAGELPVLIVPGTPGIGTYINTHTYQDMFILQSETLEMPYLGAPEPTILRIPLGTDGTVRELAIPFVMLGLACKAPQYLARVQLKIAA